MVLDRSHELHLPHIQNLFGWTAMKAMSTQRPLGSNTKAGNLYKEEGKGKKEELIRTAREPWAEGTWQPTSVYTLDNSFHWAEGGESI